MEEKPIKQAIRYLTQSNNILLVTHEKMDGDGLGSGIALYLALSKMSKNVDFISLDDVPQALMFLPRTDIVSKDIPVGNDFVISLNCTQAEVDKIKYNKIGAKLNILVSPKRGVFTKEDVEFKRGQSKYDLIIALDAGDINQLGRLYKDNVDLFYGTVLLNIDHHISNDHFGKINLVDPLATSTSEVVLSLLDGLQSVAGKDIVLMDGDIATCLLTGITVDTNSFQNQNTSPKAFSVAAQLLGHGARQQEIIKNIYKTHHLSTLKLWGRALSNIKYDDQAKIVWSGLTQIDFLDAEASEEEVHGVIDELITSAPGAEIAILFSEFSPGNFKASLRTMNNSLDANELAMFFQGGGHKRAAGFKISGDDLQFVENIVIKKLYDYQYKRLSEDVQQKSIELEEDKAVPIPSDPITREFVTKLKEASRLQSNYDQNEDKEDKTKQIEKIEDASTVIRGDDSINVETPKNIEAPLKIELPNNLATPKDNSAEKISSLPKEDIDEKELLHELETVSEQSLKDNSIETPIVVKESPILSEVVIGAETTNPSDLKVPVTSESNSGSETGGFSLNREVVTNQEPVADSNQKEVKSESSAGSEAGSFSLNREVVTNQEPVADSNQKEVTSESSAGSEVGSFSLNREVEIKNDPVVENSQEEVTSESSAGSETGGFSLNREVTGGAIPQSVQEKPEETASNLVSEQTIPVLGSTASVEEKPSYTEGLNLSLK